MAKQGRPSKHYETSWGEVVVGLRRDKKSGRFFPVGTGRESFGSDERLAVHRFRQWQSEQGIAPPLEPLDEVAQAGADLRYAIQNERDRLRALILDDPKQAALELDIPHLAWHPAKPEKPDFTLAELGADYIAKKRNRRGQRINPKYRKNLKSWWAEFLEVIGKPTYMRDITSTMIETYNDEMMRRFDEGISNDYEDGMSPTYVRGRFSAVKAIIQYGIDYTNDKAECRRVLDECARMKAPADEDQPRPMSPEFLGKLLAVSKPRDRAILLFGLNICAHAGEVKVKRSEVDLDARTYSGRRPKNRRPRVAWLWQRTVAAIREYLAESPHDSEYLFVTSHGNPVNGHRVQQTMQALRRKAELPEDVTFEGLRDAGITVAESVDPHHAKFIAGHKTGMQDKYVLRQASNPKVVECCEAIEAAFFTDSEQQE